MAPSALIGYNASWFRTDNPSNNRSYTQDFEVQGPAGNDRWRVTGTLIEQSRTAGQTWVDLASTEGTTLTAGSSPSDGTCWFVGRGGVVLVFDDTTGLKRTTVPSGEDLVRVSARSALEAVVTADGQRLRTIDRGRSWTTER